MLQPSHFDLEYAGRRARMHLPRHATDRVQSLIATRRAFCDLDVLRHIESVLRPDDLVIDVGAYVGNHAVFLAVVCHAQVLAFEPNTESFEALRANVALNGIDGRVRLDARALGAARGRGLPVVRDASDAAACHVVSDDRGPVEVVRLDDVELPRPPRVIKLDAGGMESDVVRGARETIGRYRPALYVEAPTAASIAELSSLLQPLGYEIRSQFGAVPTVLCAPTDDPSYRDSPDEVPASLRGALGEHARRMDALIERGRSSDPGQLLEVLQGMSTLLRDHVEQTRGVLEDQLRHTRRVEAELVTLKRKVENAREPAKAAPRPRPAPAAKPAAPSPTWRKLRKLGRSPREFFEDSSNTTVRRIGRVLFRSD